MRGGCPDPGICWKDLLCFFLSLFIYLFCRVGKENTSVLVFLSSGDLTPCSKWRRWQTVDNNLQLGRDQQNLLAFWSRGAVLVPTFGQQLCQQLWGWLAPRGPVSKRAWGEPLSGVVC